MEGDDILVIEPRRVGKSSTIRNAALPRAREEYGAVVAEVDLRLGAITDAVSLADALAKSALSSGAGKPVKKAQAGRLLQRTSRFVASDRAQAAGELAAQKAALKTAQNLAKVLSGDADPAERLQKVFDALEADAEDGERPVIICIDEVQDLGNTDRWKTDGGLVQRALERALRREGRLTSFVFAGSEVDAMERIFAAGQPLHLETERYRLPEISAEDWREGLTERFARDGRELHAEGVDRILRATGGHPLRTMQVCKHVLRECRKQEIVPITDALVDDAVGAARVHPSWREAE